MLERDNETMQAVLQLATSVAESGGRMYLVGGFVRDLMLESARKDIDLCVTGLTADQFQAIVPDAKPSGLYFPVFRVKVPHMTLEIALARYERKTNPGHVGFEVWAGPDVTIEDDLRRRDLTINAMALDPITEEVVDPFGGVEDLAAHTLRAVSEAFAEDPLRVYRVARFAASLGFDVAPETIDLMRRLVPELRTVSVERVVLELDKGLSAKEPSRFFRVLAEAGALAVHFKEIDDLRGVEQPPQHHPEGDAFEHTMQALDIAATLTGDHTARFAVLVHDLGKGTTPKEEWPYHRSHGDRGVALVSSLGGRLGLSARLVKAGKVASKRHMALHNIDQMRGVTIVDVLTEAERSSLGVEGLALVVDVDSRARGEQGCPSRQAEQFRALDEVRKSVHGDQVKAPPGPKFGAALRSAQGAAINAARRSTGVGA